MRFLTLLGLAAAGAGAQHLQYAIPEVEADTAEMLARFSKYVNFNGTTVNTTVPTQPRVSSQVADGSCDYWLADIQHQGVAAFNSAPSSYQVFRNVKDFGAAGDGQTDDTAAINAAISAGGRCTPGSCPSTTITPAIVYFPPGTYMISDSIIDYYYTQMIGNPNCLPTIKALSNFHGSLGMIDSDPYQSSGNLAYGSTNVFWRQIRNFIIDMTAVPANSAVTGIHWPVGQATSIQNVVFQMSTASGTQHQGIFIESGSGGFMNDLTFNGGLYGLNVGNQQFTSRGLTFNNVNIAISQIWDWGWTYQGLSINNCQIGIRMNSGTPNSLSVSSMSVIDSSITNTPIGILTGRSSSSQPAAANALILENIQITNVPTIVQNDGGVTALAGTSGSTIVAAWGQGSTSYQGTSGPSTFEGTIPVAGNGRPSSLLSGGSYYSRSKPQYEGYSSSQVVSARSFGATGNGNTDDTSALQNAINTAASQGKLLFLDHGDYLVSGTITIPAGAKIAGESFPVILSHGSYFNDLNNPRPVVQIGNPGDAGTIEWTDTILSTQGQQQGAILIQYNLASPSGAPSGLWDVHTRIGGFAGSNLQVAQCPTTPNTAATSSNINTQCIAAYMSMHVTSSSSGLYMENNWLWTADHDVENAGQTQITVYAGRGLLIESQGPVWLVGTAVEHHVKYQYQFVNARNVYAGQIQTETAYYQPNPPASLPFPYVASISDPTFPEGNNPTESADGHDVPTANGWGVRVVSSSDILIYGAGLYSFFNNYGLDCSQQGNGEYCQANNFDLEGSNNDITVYNLNIVGVHWAYNVNGQNVGLYSDGATGFSQNAASYRTN